jgi:hypothetical protein
VSDTSWCLLRIGDGRDDDHERAWESLEQMLPSPDHIVTIDDRDHKLGFAGAIAEGWRQVRETGAAFCSTPRWISPTTRRWRSTA